MTSTRWFRLIVASFLAALGVSGWLYLNTRTADFDSHAQVVQGFARVRHASARLSEQVLAARFGLLNQYDPLTATSAELLEAESVLRPLLEDTVGADAKLAAAIDELRAAVGAQRAALERFKAENSVLKNSLYYLPTAADHLTEDASRSPAAGAAGAPTEELVVATAGATAHDVERVLRAALVYNLVGDQSSQTAFERSLGELDEAATKAPAKERLELELFLDHAHVIRNKQPSVDGWLRGVVENDVAAKLRTLDAVYEARFSHAVSESSRNKRILYGWSLFLLLAVAATALQLRRVYADLERRVLSRTAELKEAVSALWGEMQLARRIQEALVPAAPKLESCEIAAVMKPTADVGGDYYDVVRAGDREWILIGDVSGHGVPAGLVMMMCQTAVRTVLSVDPTVEPHHLLATVNRVLTQNIRQLGEEKYMTISAFRRDPDGTISFAGAHQDVFIYRAREDRVETLETSGLWLGLKDEIAHTLETRSFTLHDRDVLLILTDGITEATRNGALFDTRGVRRVMESARGKSAEDILASLFSELAQFEIKDDASVLVLRQLGTMESRLARAS
jgi:serine phosphatase RsbU (regulator of sigma subunit)